MLEKPQIGVFLVNAAKQSEINHTFLSKQLFIHATLIELAPDATINDMLHLNISGIFTTHKQYETLHTDNQNSAYARQLPMATAQQILSGDDSKQFFERTLAMHHWMSILKQTPSVAGLMELHGRYKYWIMAHSPHLYKQMGYLVAKTTANTFEHTKEKYLDLLIETFNIPENRGLHANALQHIWGYFKHDASQQQKQKLLQSIEQYRQAQIPFSKPRQLLTGFLLDHPNPYLEKQQYLSIQAEQLSQGFAINHP